MDRCALALLQKVRDRQREKSVEQQRPVSRIVDEWMDGIALSLSSVEHHEKDRLFTCSIIVRINWPRKGLLTAREHTFVRRGKRLF